MSANFDKDPAKERAEEKRKSDVAMVRDWIKEGDCVVLHNQFKNAKIYHNKCNDNKDSKIQEKTRFIYLEMKAFPPLLNEDEWPQLLKEWGCSLCSCKLKEYVENADNDKIKNYHQMAISLPAGSVVEKF